MKKMKKISLALFVSALALFAVPSFSLATPSKVPSFLYTTVGYECVGDGSMTANPSSIIVSVRDLGVRPSGMLYRRSKIAIQDSASGERFVPEFAFKNGRNSYWQLPLALWPEDVSGASPENPVRVAWSLSTKNRMGFATKDMSYEVTGPRNRRNCLKL